MEGGREGEAHIADAFKERHQGGRRQARRARRQLLLRWANW
jgi:hypothetical protein